MFRVQGAGTRARMGAGFSLVWFLHGSIASKTTISANCKMCKIPFINFALSGLFHFVDLIFPFCEANLCFSLLIKPISNILLEEFRSVVATFISGMLHVAKYGTKLFSQCDRRKV